MNLLHDPWMPVRDAQGQRHWITPDQLADPQWLAFDADRPDFNGALAQFAIGLLQTTTTIADVIEWRRLLATPPTAEILRSWFDPLAAVFALDGDGRRFMQDAELGSQEVERNEICSLLIESPGENTIKNNKDLFVKRSQMNALCPACAATALLTLQLNAPAGGQGNRTGLRGGGPLTTLVMAPPGGSLWHNVWMNVRDRPAFLLQGGDPGKTELRYSFPWMAPISALQSQKSELAQVQVHPAHCFWAMPRRIWLDTADCIESRCDGCQRQSNGLIKSYSSKNYGLNYKGTWSHPLSPYYRDKKEGWLAVHPQSDGLGYQHWLAWILGVDATGASNKVAEVVVHAMNKLHRQTGGAVRLWAFGYDMENMKPLCWYESTLPLYGLADCDRDARQGIQAEVGRWLEAAKLASEHLLGAVRDAWFPDIPKSRASNSKKLGHTKVAFWSATEIPFYNQLRILIDSVNRGTDFPELLFRQGWHASLTRNALKLFDDHFVGSGSIEFQNPQRTARAHRQLVQNLDSSELRKALGLPVNEEKAKPARKGTKRANKETT